MSFILTWEGAAWFLSYHMGGEGIGIRAYDSCVQTSAPDATLRFPVSEHRLCAIVHWDMGHAVHAMKIYFLSP